jgi:hypothetical protein
MSNDEGMIKTECQTDVQRLFVIPIIAYFVGSKF